MSGKSVLLVEGRDDEHVVKSICGHFKLGEIKNIREQKGIGRLLTGLPIYLKESDVSALGIIVDADNDRISRWQSVAAHLKKSGYCGISDGPDKEGTIIMPPAGPKQRPKIGVWVMPDNQSNGYLEDFLRRLINPDESLYSYAKNVVEKLPEKRFNDVHTSKAIMHSWLAWQKEPGKPFGQSITAGYLDADLSPAPTFAQWLQRLFFE